MSTLVINTFIVALCHQVYQCVYSYGYFGTVVTKVKMLLKLPYLPKVPLFTGSRGYALPFKCLFLWAFPAWGFGFSGLFLSSAAARGRIPTIPECSAVPL